MLGDEGEHEEEECHHGDDNTSWDPQSVETGSHAKPRNSTNITADTKVMRSGCHHWSCPKK